MAARVLRDRGRKVRLIEKARGVGGRLATRRLGDHTADLGAQFFTAHDSQFRALVRDWVEAGVARQWSTGFHAPDGTFRDNGVPRYRGNGGMASIAKHLAEGLDVRLQAKAVRAEAAESGWKVSMEDGSVHTARALLLTAPVPQSLALLQEGHVTIPDPAGSDLAQIDYAPCLTLLATLTSPSQIPEPGGLWMSGEPLLWMADNVLKGVSATSTPVVTLHAGQEFSRDHWETPEPEVTAMMLAAAKPWLGSPVATTYLHRWRYSVPLRVHPEPFVVVRAPAPLGFAGDAFGGPRVEAAALSGHAAGAALAEVLT
ncbi:MAG: FAD-dependent oxidoreductase [Verrucomicrobiae bacterium]|nr:FAD-dependent oxidoreductase [Verrucomicrobiae bacterium]